MNDFGAWMQDNWYQLGSFFVQFAFLCAAIWFARRILRTLRASQEQIGALVKLSFFGTPPERHSPEHTPAPEAAPLQNPASEASPYWLPPAPLQPSTAFVTSRDNPIHLVSSGPGFLGWLKSPMTITTGSSPFHRILRWLQSPAHN